MTTPQELATGAKCINCGLAGGLQGAALVYLFGKIAGVTDVQTIVEGAKCISTCIPPGMQTAALIWLADKILEAETTEAET